MWESLGFVSRFCRFRLGTLNGEETGIGVEEFDDGEKGKAEESKRSGMLACVDELSSFIFNQADFGLAYFLASRLMSDCRSYRYSARAVYSLSVLRVRWDNATRWVLQGRVTDLPVEGLHYGGDSVGQTFRVRQL